jgi:branched-chain amino acid transport system permease protein
VTSTQIFLENFLQSLVASVQVGSMYGLMCVGLGMIFGVMRVINFAQGDFLMLGMYVAYYLMIGFGVLTFLGSSVGPFAAACLAGPVLYVAGYYLHRWLISRVTGIRVVSAEAEGHYAQLILTLGMSLVLQNGGLIVFGSMPQLVRTPLASRAWEVRPFFDDYVSVFVNQARSYSCLGKSLRAAADDPEAATYMGIDVDRAHRIAFGVGVGITAIAGGLVGTYYPFQPYVGLEFVIIMYAGVVLGGMGSTLGAFLGGMTIGFVQQLSTLVLPTQLQNTAIFVVFLIIVMFRPQGLFGHSVERT